MTSQFKQQDRGHSSIRALLRQTFRGRGEPMLCDVDGTWVPADALWTLSRNQVRILRDAGCQPGDTLAVDATAGRRFISLLIAALHEGLNLMPLPPETDPPIPVRARFRTDTGQCEYIRQAHPCPGPEGGGLILRTSGTTGPCHLYRLSMENLLAVWNSHLPRLGGLEGCRAWCGLPLHHAFGLVLDLFPAFFLGQAVLLPRGDPRDMDRMLQTWKAHRVNRFCGVPLQFRRLMEADPTALRQLQGGLMGGAPCPDVLATALQGSRIQPGYGLTEASPGVTLGEPGEWSPGELGQPVGCVVRINEADELEFQGPNAVTHQWRDGSWQKLDADRWVATGDRVTRSADNRYQFLGRTASGWKMENGRWLQPEPLEAYLQQNIQGLEHVLLRPGKTGGVELLVPDHLSLSLETWAGSLGSPGAKLERVVPVKPDGWHMTPKGEIDRAAMEGLAMFMPPPLRRLI